MGSALMCGRVRAWATKPLFTIVLLAMVTPYLAAQVVIFQDDFADGIIDPANWATVDGAGQVREEDGYLKLIYRGGSPPHQQIRTAPDLLRDNVTITLNVKPAYVRSDKNAGLWVGDANAAAPTGYTCFWSQKWRRVSVSKFYLGESNGDLEYRIVKEYGGDPAYFDDHEFVVQVSPDAVSFYLDGELMGVDYATTRRRTICTSPPVGSGWNPGTASSRRYG